MDSDTQGRGSEDSDFHVQRPVGVSHRGTRRRHLGYSCRALPLLGRMPHEGRRDIHICGQSAVTSTAVKRISPPAVTPRRAIARTFTYRRGQLRTTRNTIEVGGPAE
eukprot:271465-Prymnesium_polylepis.1